MKRKTKIIEEKDRSELLFGVVVVDSSVVRAPDEKIVDGGY
jgi:hypothetical protein